MLSLSRFIEGGSYCCPAEFTPVTPANETDGRQVHENADYVNAATERATSLDAT